MSTQLPPSSPLKRTLDTYVPFLYRPVRSVFQAIQALRFSYRYGNLAKKIIAERGPVVQSGPFRGMRYLDRACSSALIPKLLGTYEDELHPELEQILSRKYETVVDIGSAEGYYAVGLAMRFPNAEVLAYDIDPVALGMCKQLAELNGVRNRIAFRSLFAAEHLRDHRGNMLVVCDVDGFETELFAAGTEPYWAKADLLIELHDFMGNPCRTIVEQCLAPTHNLEIVSSQEKSGEKIADLKFLTPEERRIAVNELRPPQEWLIAYAEDSRHGSD